MSEGAIQNFMGREFRAMQQVIGRSASRNDVIMAMEKFSASAASKRDVELLRILLEDVRAELRQQRLTAQHTSIIVDNMRGQVQNMTQRLR